MLIIYLVKVFFLKLIDIIFVNSKTLNTEAIKSKYKSINRLINAMHSAKSKIADVKTLFFKFNVIYTDPKFLLIFLKFLIIFLRSLPLKSGHNLSKK